MPGHEGASHGSVRSCAVLRVLLPTRPPANWLRPASHHPQPLRARRGLCGGAALPRDALLAFKCHPFLLAAAHVY